MISITYIISYVCAGICILALLEKSLGLVDSISYGWKRANQLCPKEELEDLNTFTERDKLYEGKVNVSLRNYQKRNLLRWCCQVTVPIEEMDEQGLPTEKEKKALWDLIGSIDFSLRLKCTDVPYPLIVGFVEGNNVCSIYWMVSNPENAGKVLGKLKLDRKLQYTMRQDPFWIQFNTLLEEL